MTFGDPGPGALRFEAHGSVKAPLEASRGRIQDFNDAIGTVSGGDRSPLDQISGSLDNPGSFRRGAQLKRKQGGGGHPRRAQFPRIQKERKAQGGFGASERDKRDLVFHSSDR